MPQVQHPSTKGEIALIAVGSNAESRFGNPLKTVRAAFKMLDAAFGVDCTKSQLYETPAFPAGAGPDFVNAAVAVRTALDPNDILTILHGIEAMADRVRDQRWGPRTLDLDLIGYGDKVRPDAKVQGDWRDLAPERQAVDVPDRLILPHPRLQDRAFVLVPLADIAADWQHPVLQLTVAALLARCPQADRDSVKPLAAQGNLLVNPPSRY